MITAWIEDDALPSGLRPETSRWDDAAVRRLLDRRSPGHGSPAHR